MQSEGQNCQSIIDSIKEDMSQVTSEKALVRSIAAAVSDKMGGVLDKWRVTHSIDSTQ